MYAMLPMFDKDSEEYKELEKRIKIMRMYQGNAIDKTKGISYTPPKKEWSKKQKYLLVPDSATKDDIDRINKENEKIKFNNSICCDKKAYFFGYVYPVKMQEYKNHRKICNTECLIRFGISFNELLNLKEKTPEQKNFIRNYYRYAPLFNSDCTMNILTRYIEDLDLQYKRGVKNRTFDFRCLMSTDADNLDKKIIYRFRSLIKKYTRFNKDIMRNISISEPYLTDDELKDMKSALFDCLYQDFLLDCLSIEPDVNMCVNYIVYVCYAVDMNCQKSLLWYCFGDTLVDNIKANSNHRYKVVESSDGKEYFGKLVKIIDENEECSL